MPARLPSLAIASLALSAAASAQSVNINIGFPSTHPPPGYGGAGESPGT